MMGLVNYGLGQYSPMSWYHFVKYLILFLFLFRGLLFLFDRFQEAYLKAQAKLDFITKPLEIEVSSCINTK